MNGLPIEATKASRLHASRYQKLDWHSDQPKIKMSNPNGGWHNGEWDAVDVCRAA